MNDKEGWQELSRVVTPFALSRHLSHRQPQEFCAARCKRELQLGRNALLVAVPFYKDELHVTGEKF